MINLDIETAFNDLDFDALKQDCLSCTKCELHQGRTQVVFGHGPFPSDVMVIGEGPGENEDLQGKPFIGRAGQLLTKMFEAVGIDREKEVYIANTVKCRPPQNRTPLPSEIEACSGYLVRQIQLIQPKILILLGAPAMKTILSGDLKISKTRGTWFKLPVPYSEEPIYVMPTFHPSYLLRNASKEKGSPKWLAWQDFKEVKAALDYYRLENP